MSTVINDSVEYILPAYYNILFARMKCIYWCFIFVIIVMISGARRGSNTKVIIKVDGISYPNNLKVNQNKAQIKEKKKPKGAPRQSGAPRPPKAKAINVELSPQIPKNPSWRNCQRISCSTSGVCAKPWTERMVTNCCSDALYTMLSDVITILDKQFDPMIMYGTLIGSLREQDIISYTPDSDIALTSTVYNSWQTWKKYLNDAGYLIFKSNILRICKASTSTSKHNHAPWGREWFPYIDLYHFVSRNNRVHSTHLTNIRWPRNYLWPIKKCKIRGKDFPCPNRGELILDSLKKYYGNWRVQQKRGSLINPKKIPRKFPALLPVLVQQKIKDKSKCGVKLWGNSDNWSQSEMYKYEAVANIINALRQVGIDSFLTGGSALGAYRNHGWFSWDKDADLIVVSTDYVKIEQALKSIPIYFYETSTHKNVTADIPSDKGGFGYHVSIPGVGKHKTPYIDLWLFEKTKDNKLQCKGFNNGCQRWCRQHSKKTCKPISRNWVYPFNYVPYGPYLMPTIRKPYLDLVYGKSWPSKCGYGKTSCSNRYHTDVFVFFSKDEDGNVIETGKLGDVVKHRFVIKSGEYQLLGANRGVRCGA